MVIPITPTPITGFPVGYINVPNITPFTYKDGLTYLQILEDLRRYIRDTVVPHTDDSFKLLTDAVDREITELVGAVNNALSGQADSVNVSIRELSDSVENKIAEVGVQLSEQDAAVAEQLASNLNSVNAAVQQVVNSTIEVTRPVIESVTFDEAEIVARNAARTMLSRRNGRRSNDFTGHEISLGQRGQSKMHTDLGTVTISTENSGSVITSTPHGLVVGSRVAFGSVIQAPTGAAIVSGNTYYVTQVVNANSVRISSTAGGNPFTWSVSGNYANFYKDWNFQFTAYDRDNNRVRDTLRVTRCIPRQRGTSFPQYDVITPTQTAASLYGMAVEIESTEEIVDFGLFNTGGNERWDVYIDGMFWRSYLGTEINAAAGAGGEPVISMKFPDSRRRRIRLVTGGAGALRAYYARTATPAVFKPIYNKGPRYLNVGDSFTEGAGSGANMGGVNPTGLNYGEWFAQLLNIDDYWNGGAGGTGLVTPGPLSRPALIDRYQTDIIDKAPQTLILAMGINDRAAYASNPATVRNALSTILDAVRSALPMTEIIVCGPFPNGGGNNVVADFVNMDSDFESIAKVRNIQFISPIQSGVKFTLADPTHPDALGHYTIGLWIAGQLANVLI